MTNGFNHVHHQEVVISGASHMLLYKYFQLASFVMLIYDHIITFSDEVERVWNRRISGVTLLFLANRYCTALGMIVDLVAFHYPKLTRDVCQRFVAFEGFVGVGIVAVCELTMILRVVAFYNRARAVIILLSVLWIGQGIISAVGFSTGHAAELPRSGLIGCLFTGHRTIFSAMWMAALVTNAMTFGLTVYRSTTLFLGPDTPISRVFIRDGAMYFSVIFLANLANTLTYFLVIPDLRTLSATFTILITSVMVSRLVLNLRGAARPRFSESYWDGRQTLPIGFINSTLDHAGQEIDSAFCAESVEDVEPQIPLRTIPTYYHYEPPYSNVRRNTIK